MLAQAIQRVDGHWHLKLEAGPTFLFHIYHNEIFTYYLRSTHSTVQRSGPGLHVL